MFLYYLRTIRKNRETTIWDADKNWVGMTMNGDNYSFAYDTTAGIPAVIEEVTPDGSIFYIREPGGELIARVDGSDIRYYHFDELGSTRMLTDGTGTVTDRYVFDAWGNTLSHTGATDQPYQYVGRLGYYTHTQDPEFALMQLGVRFYDAEVGRFGQRDLVDSDDSAYVYVGGNPIERMDPSGLFYCHWGFNWWSFPPIYGYHCHRGDPPKPPKPPVMPVLPPSCTTDLRFPMDSECVEGALADMTGVPDHLKPRAKLTFGRMTCWALDQYLEKPWLPPGPATKKLNEMAIAIWDKCCAGKGYR